MFVFPSSGHTACRRCCCSCQQLELSPSCTLRSDPLRTIAGQQRRGGHGGRCGHAGRHHRHGLGSASARLRMHACMHAAPCLGASCSARPPSRSMQPAPTCCDLSLLGPCRFPSLPPPAAPHDLAAYLSLLKTDGRLVLVGLPPEPLSVPPFALTARESQRVHLCRWGPAGCTAQGAGRRPAALRRARGWQGDSCPCCPSRCAAPPQAAAWWRAPASAASRRRRRCWTSAARRGGGGSYRRGLARRCAVACQCCGRGRACGRRCAPTSCTPSPPPCSTASPATSSASAWTTSTKPWWGARLRAWPADVCRANAVPFTRRPALNTLKQHTACPALPCRSAWRATTSSIALSSTCRARWWPEGDGRSWEGKSAAGGSARPALERRLREPALQRAEHGPCMHAC